MVCDVGKAINYRDMGIFALLNDMNFFLMLIVIVISKATRRDGVALESCSSNTNSRQTGGMTRPLFGGADQQGGGLNLDF